jgi:hypothetical protein
MREEPAGVIETGSDRKELEQTGSGLERKYRVALVLYAVLAVLSWFTLDGRVLVMGKPVELRLVPMLILAGFALRTMVAMHADRIRRSGE